MFPRGTWKLAGRGVWLSAWWAPARASTQSSWAAWGKAQISSRKSLVLRPRTIVIRPFSAAAAATLARTSFAPVARMPRAL
jgi:hypothetical protein